MEIAEELEWAGDLGLGEFTGVEGKRSLREIYDIGLIEMRSKSPDDEEEDADDAVTETLAEEEEDWWWRVRFIGNTTGVDMELRRRGRTG